MAGLSRTSLLVSVLIVLWTLRKNDCLVLVCWVTQSQNVEFAKFFVIRLGCLCEEHDTLIEFLTRWHDKSTKFCQFGNGCVVLPDAWFSFCFYPWILSAPEDYVYWQSCFHVVVVNINTSQVWILVRKFAIIGVINWQQFWPVYLGCFDKKCKLVVDRLEAQILYFKCRDLGWHQHINWLCSDCRGFHAKKVDQFCWHVWATRSGVD